MKHPRERHPYCFYCFFVLDLENLFMNSESLFKEEVLGAGRNNF
jgi:hypothetical protein